MKIKVLIVASALSLASLAILSAGMKDTSQVYQVSDGRTISFDRMIRNVKKTDFILVGEVHNNQEHHRLELKIIRSLHEAGVPLAIGLEMFRADSQNALNSWIRGTLPIDQFLPVYYDNWRQAWPLYRDIFLYAREHRIPMVGLNIPDRIAQAVAQNGFASLSTQEKKQLPPSISCDVDPTYMEFIRQAYAQHPRTHDKKFLNFCEAQMVWDKSMAWNLIEYRKKHTGETVVVLAGVGHAWKRGIPDQISRESKDTFKIIMPIVPDQIEQDTVTDQDADYVLLE